MRLNGPFDYSLFGLHIRSELELPGLVAADPQADPDVSIGLGEVAAAPVDGNPLRQIDGTTLLSIPDVARYAISVDRITIHRHPGVPAANVRLFLLGTAMGILLHQRRLLPLHANAVEIGGKAIAVMGRSGAGKSTLAGWFHDNGYRIIADDVCAVRFDEDLRPLVSPGVPRLRLWREALESTGREPLNYERSYAGEGPVDKFDVPISPGALILKEVELAGIYLLGEGDHISFNRLRGVDAVEALFANTYRGAYVPVGGDARFHAESCIRLATHTPIFQFVRNWDLSRLAEHGSALVGHAQREPETE